MEEIEDERDDSDQDEEPVDGRIAEETQESVVERLAERRYRDAVQADVREESIEGLGLPGDEPDRGRVVGGIWRGVRRHVDRRSNVVSVLRGERTEDRKSTRLNCSHLGISYAVYCLIQQSSP